MKINVELNNIYKEIEILIKTAEFDDTVKEIMNKLSENKIRIIIGYANNKTAILEEDNIIRIYSANKKVYAKTLDAEYIVKIPLYEVFERLNQKKFVRISNAEIVNLKKIVELDLSFTGTICIKMSNGDISYVSRRYVSQIKKTLGIGGSKN